MEYRLLIWIIVSGVSIVYAMFLVKDLLKLLTQANRLTSSSYGAHNARSAIWVGIFKCSLVVLTIPMTVSFLKNEYAIPSTPDLLDIVFVSAYGLVILAMYVSAFDIGSDKDWEITQRGFLSKERLDRIPANEGLISGLTRNWWFCKNIVKVYGLVIVFTVAMLYKVIV